MRAAWPLFSHPGTMSPRVQAPLLGGACQRARSRPAFLDFTCSGLAWAIPVRAPRNGSSVLQATLRSLNPTRAQDV